jgi:hypothetical protein
VAAGRACGTTTFDSTEEYVMNRTINRRLAPASLLAAMALIVAQPGFAVAQPPSVVDDPKPFVVPAGLGCPGFDLEVDGTAGRARVIRDKNGQPARVLTVATGVVITYTNLGLDGMTRGKSISFKTSGSVTSIVTEGTTETWTATGHNGLILFPTDVPAGPTTTQYSGGRIVFTVDTLTGVFTLVSASGNATDVCAALG